MTNHKATSRLCSFPCWTCQANVVVEIANSTRAMGDSWSHSFWLLSYLITWCVWHRVIIRCEPLFSIIRKSILVYFAIERKSRLEITSMHVAQHVYKGKLWQAEKYTRLRHGNSALLAFVREIHCLLVTKKVSNADLGYFLPFTDEQMLNNLWSCRWFDTPRHLWDVTVMHTNVDQRLISLMMLQWWFQFDENISLAACSFHLFNHCMFVPMTRQHHPS